MSLLDVLLLLLIAGSTALGYRRGVVLQLLTYGGLLAGLLVGAVIAPTLASLAGDPVVRAGVATAALFAMAGAGEVAGWFAGSALRTAARRRRFSPLDAIGGSFVSAIATLLAIWFIGLNLVNGPVPALAREIRNSVVIQGLGASLPRPPPALTEVGRFLNHLGFPQVFTGLPPEPGEPVRGPTTTQTQIALEAGSPSTVLVSGTACGELHKGSGFLVDPRYVVTNAHVVAGVHDPLVESDGSRQTGVPVLYDPDLDVAVLRVAREAGPPLRLAGEEAGRGDAGAVLGFPGLARELVGTRAAIRRTIDAIGPDIYGSGTVEREVLELQAEIERGNSGGPFVLVTGEVAGVVFAASTTDSRIGYALTASEVAPAVEAAAGRTAAVSTGDCI